MINIKIRQAKAEDLNRVKQVTKQAYRVPCKENGFITRVTESRNIRKEFLRKEFYVLVAECDEKIVGTVRYTILNRELYFFRLAVLKTYRGRGIASTLIRNLEKIACRNGCDKILLDCAREKELPSYYIKLGFKIDKIVDYQHYHGVYMSKTIN